jgi:hypothetical protein
VLEKVCLMFQGGFVGIDCDLLIENADGSCFKLFSFFPEDINDLQSFQLPDPISIKSDCKLHLKFNQSSDFYGRITIYILKLEGQSS